MKKKIKILGKFFRNIFKLDKSSKAFIEHNLRYFKNNNKYEKEFLIDYFESFEAEIPRSYFFNSYSEKYKCNLKVFSLKKNILLNYQWKKIYRSFNARDFNYIFFYFFYLYYFFNLKKKKIVKNFFNSLRDKKQIFDFKYKDIEIGRDIYDEYLYRYKQYTININDKRLKTVIYDFTFTIDYWINYFNKNKVSGICLSHPNVRLLGIIGKVANKYFKIPVYSVTNNYIKKRLDLADHFKFINDDLMNMPKAFSKLDDNKKKEAKDWSKKQLEKRLQGEVGVNMYYSKGSAFGKKMIEKSLKETDKIKILICTHEFYEWLIFLGNKSKNSPYEWYIKNHPDCDKWTKSIVKDFVDKFSEINLVNEKTSFLQLKKEGLNFVFTCHGTVGHECPLIDIQVINADLNHPHKAYNFNWSPKNIEDYDQMINKLHQLNKKTNTEEIYEFYYIRNNLELKDDLIFNSYNEAKKIEQDKNNIIDIFLSQSSEQRHNKIIKNINNLI